MTKVESTDDKKEHFFAILLILNILCDINHDVFNKHGLRLTIKFVPCLRLTIYHISWQLKYFCRMNDWICLWG